MKRLIPAFLFTLSALSVVGCNDSDRSAVFPPPETPSITTTSLPIAYEGQSYNSSISSTGGTAPYSYDVLAGNLPPGLTLDTSTGDLLVTPSTGAGGNLYSFTVRVTDGASSRATQDLGIGVSGGNVTITNAGALSNGQVGNSYSYTMNATTGAPPYTWSIYSGALPTGLSLDSGTGVISGTPTISGSYTGIGIQVNSPDGSTASSLIGITIAP